MSAPIIETAGEISLIAATTVLLDTEERSTAELAVALGCRLPSVWPPEFNGQPYRDWQRNLLAAHSDAPDWAGWYIVASGELAGTCGFKGPPDVRGEVEVGYSVIAPLRRRGIATAAVNLLMARAFRDPRVIAVLAETLPEADISQAVLRRCSFLPAGSRLDPEDGEVLRFSRKR